MSNRLLREKSPYLLQHAENPVDWYPWGQEALGRAAREDKPILVSIGYSACHWCHVMAHESFEDEAIGRLMNEHLVNIKVDREERPDIDAIYMTALQGLSSHGGWPLNMFLTPDGRPFFGGTYFPPTERHGLPSWRQVIEGIAQTYRERRDDVEHNAEVLAAYVDGIQKRLAPHQDVGHEVLQAGLATLLDQKDPIQGGFGGAPKFPQPLSLQFLLRMYTRTQDPRLLDLVELTLQRMAAGGIHDQLGGGFHRYTVDGKWIVPHFEKMLYDNALLAGVYLDAYLVTRVTDYRDVVEDTLDYLLRDMSSSEGGFYSSEDADSEGEEGRYYLWTSHEVEQVLNADVAAAFSEVYGVRPPGNFEGRVILTVDRPLHEVAGERKVDEAEFASSMRVARKKLLEVRERRVHPRKDTKILVSWNALAIKSLARAGRALQRPDYVDAARRAADFLLNSLVVDGTLMRSFRGETSKIAGFLEDYAFLVEALLALYEASFDVRYFESAQQLAEQMIGRFWDPEESLLYDTSGDAEPLLTRPRSIFDNPIPSGNASAAHALLALQALTGTEQYAEITQSIVESAGNLPAQAPGAIAYLLCAADTLWSTPLQIAIVGDPSDAGTRALMNAVATRYLPTAVSAVGTREDVPLLQGRTMIDGVPTAYVCHNFACRLPVTTVEGLTAQLDELVNDHARNQRG